MEVEKGDDVEMDDVVEDSSTEETDEGDGLAQKIECDDGEVEIIDEEILVPESSRKRDKGKGKEVQEAGVEVSATYDEMKRMNRELLAKIADLEMKKTHDDAEKTFMETKISALEIENEELKIETKAAERWFGQLTDLGEKGSIVEAYAQAPWEAETSINDLGKMHVFDAIIKSHFTCGM